MDILGNLGHLIMAFPYYAAVVGVSVVFAIIYRVYKTSIDFWAMDAWYSTPVIGRLAQLSRRVAPAAGQDFKGWLQSEVTLGSDYANYIHGQSPKTFRQYRTYLGRAGDGGRKPLPGWLVAVLLVLVAAEAYGISYLIAGGLARNMSENARIIGTGAIVIVVCIGLVLLTHAAGKHLYRNLLVSRTVKKWSEATTNAELADGAVARENSPFETHAGITVEEGHLDDKDPDYSQCINRVGSKTTWFVVWIALAIILIFGGLQVALRVNDSLQKLTRDTIGLSTDAAVQGVPSSPIPDFGDPQATAQPAILSAPDQLANRRAAEEMKSTETQGGWLTSLALAFIYLMTQLTSIYAGYSYGFGGEYSEEAYRETHGCQVFETYQQAERKLKGLADRRMQSLHQRIRDRAANRNIALNGDFYRFLAIHERRAARHREESEAETVSDEAVSPSAPNAASPSPLAGKTPARPVTDAAQPVVTDTGGVQQHLDRMEPMSKEEIKTYMLALSPEEYDKVRPHLPALMAARADKARRGSDMDGLLSGPEKTPEARSLDLDEALNAANDSNVVKLGSAVPGAAAT